MSTFLEVQHCQMTFKGLQAVKEFSATIEAGTICGLILVKQNDDTLEQRAQYC